MKKLHKKYEWCFKGVMTGATLALQRTSEESIDHNEPKWKLKLYSIRNSFSKPQTKFFFFKKILNINTCAPVCSRFAGLYFTSSLKQIYFPEAIRTVYEINMIWQFWSRKPFKTSECQFRIGVFLISFFHDRFFI